MRTRRQSSAAMAYWPGSFAEASLAMSISLMAVMLGWRGSDLPAQIFRIELVRRHGFVLWNNQWFSGHPTLGYSVLVPSLGAVLGPIPLAVISGLAQELRSAAGTLPPAQLAECAQMILSQTQRAAQVARQLAEVAAPQPAELDWTDVNAQVRSVLQLMGYDRRYRGFAFEFAADPALPAVRTSGNAVQQVLMQMLALGCEAMVAARVAPLRVDIATAPSDAGGVEVQLHFAPVLDFSRGEVQRSLLLARATVEPLGGRLAFGQADAPRLQIKLALPAERGGAEG